MATGEKGLNRDVRSTAKQQKRRGEGEKKENSKILQNQEHKFSSRSDKAELYLGFPCNQYPELQLGLQNKARCVLQSLVSEVKQLEYCNKLRIHFPA